MTRRAVLTPRLLWLLAITCGLTVANLYYVQPLLPFIAASFHTATGPTAMLVTLTQLGYTAGLVILVPLGDFVERRTLTTVLLAACGVGLLAAVFAPALWALGIALVLVGVTSVVAQVLIPFTATLAEHGSRGRAVGLVMSGLLIGMLLSRTLAGLITEGTDWRVVYGIAAVLMFVLLLVLRRQLPVVGADAKRGSDTVRGTAMELARSLVMLVRTEPELRRRALYGACGFAAFSVLWTDLAFLLAGPNFHYPAWVIGLFGLVGAAGAFAASRAGRLADKGHARLATVAFLSTIVVSYVVIATGAHHVVPLVIGITLLDLGVQGTQVTNQSVIYQLRGEARSRITTIYMASYFLGGVIGSSIAAVANDAGWTTVCITGAAPCVLALLVWVISGRHANVSVSSGEPQPLTRKS